MIFGLFAKKAPTRPFDGPDGTRWAVELRWPSATNAMVVFIHPDGRTTARNRYAWWIADGPEARDVTARLDPKRVLGALTDADIGALFRRSMPISSQVPRFEPA
ncbi:MAG: hypothetical protein JO180_06620 [Gemmatirosa sp.]|nr:hypothetical protein [Gemmatirosa sp.]